MRLPTSVEPVKEIARTAGLPTSSSPISEPDPVTIFNTPAGTPASTNNSTSLRAVKLVNSAGFHTTVLPQTSAGAIFQTGIATGKFQGVIRPTTPSGCRMV